MNLKPHQIKWVQQLRERKNFCLFGEQRTGKSPATAKASEIFNKVIGVTLAGQQHKWKQEYLTWTNRQDIFIAMGDRNKRRKVYQKFFNAKTGILLVSIHAIKLDMADDTNDSPYLIHFMDLKDVDLIFLDEAHFLRHNKTLQSQQITYVRKFIKYAWSLTGTPSTSHAADVLRIFAWTYQSRNYSKTLKQHFNVSMGRWGGIERKECLNKLEWAKYVNSLSSNIRLKEVKHDLPKIMWEQVVLNYNQQQQATLDKLMRQWSYEGHEKQERILILLDQINRWRQIDLDANILNNVKKHTLSPKTNWLIEFCQENTNHFPIIIWSSYTRYLNYLKDKLPKKVKVVLLTGNTNPKQKAQIEQDIQGGKIDILLANIKCGAMGWTFDKVDTMIYTNLDWDIILNTQSVSRFWPTLDNVSTNPKKIFWLNMEEDSADGLVLMKLKHKWSSIELTNNFQKILKKHL